MKPISENQIDQTLDELDEFTEEIASEKLAEIANVQPELLSFVVEFTEEMSPDVQELSFYMFFVIYRTFQAAYGKNIEEISLDEIIEVHEKNEALMDKLEGTHEKFIERIAETQLMQQPHLMSYVVEALVEESEDEELEPLSEEESGILFLLSKIVIEVLDRKTEE
ncbi:MAG: hypothetical protein PHP23_03965 [Desulfobacterales bacterium]|nr:hypothetical protein [Desulfobacterales bacterium]MDD4392964.1 hypothetical protein [Desulfobacterales bacterium]